MSEAEITEERLKTLLSSSTVHIVEFISDHPEIIYKGVPFVIAIYIISPAVLMTWQWLPWIWTTYEIYQRVPPGLIPIVVDLWKKYTISK